MQSSSLVLYLTLVLTINIDRTVCHETNSTILEPTTTIAPTIEIINDTAVTSDTKFSTTIKPSLIVTAQSTPEMLTEESSQPVSNNLTSSSNNYPTTTPLPPETNENFNLTTAISSEPVIDSSTQSVERIQLSTSQSVTDSSASKSTKDPTVVNSVSDKSPTDKEDTLPELGNNDDGDYEDYYAIDNNQTNNVGQQPTEQEIGLGEWLRNKLLAMKPSKLFITIVFWLISALVTLSCVACISVSVYRYRHPVRMDALMGKKFSTFENPKYCKKPTLNLDSVATDQRTNTDRNSDNKV